MFSTKKLSDASSKIIEFCCDELNTQ